MLPALCCFASTCIYQIHESYVVNLLRLGLPEKVVANLTKTHAENEGIKSTVKERAFQS